MSDSSATARDAEAAMRALLADQPVRCMHSAAVASRAAQLSQGLRQTDRQAVVAASWLHDVGHARRLRSTGLHALDGARHLVGRFPRRVVALVAHHSGARFEAEVRGLRSELGAFELEVSVIADLLTYCDLTTGPGGERVELSDRLAEVESRYGVAHPVVRSLQLARAELDRAVARIERELLGAATVHRSAAGPPVR